MKGSIMMFSVRIGTAGDINTLQEKFNCINRTVPTWQH
uniref:Uncharacterized protein n=1 Tax=Arundo donax TaxID=35708 RepID=A0A0A9BMK0_ARUDO